MSHLVLIILSLCSLAHAWQPDFILRLTNTTVNSDCTPRESIVINGTSPGPLIRLTEGEHYWIRVYNDVPDQNTTIHFHGFTQYLSPFSDGTPLGSGWPIPPGHFYDYEFQLEPGFKGTYWYHSHVSMQDMTAYGPIIVDPPSGQSDGCPVEYDDDLVMMTSDYYHATQEQLVANLLNKTAFHWVGDPQSLLINGHAPYKCNASTLAPGQSCASPTSCGVSQMFVKPNTRYRVRVIATGALSYLQMALEGHDMTVFEVDGTYIEPIPIQDLQIQIGQRYSVLIETMTNPPKQDYYWRFRSMWRPTRTNGAAMWTYRDDANCAPLQTDMSNATVPANLNTTVYLANETFGWIDGQFEEYKQTEYPPKDSEVTRRIWLDNKQITWDGNNQTLRWSVNQRLYNESIPTTPILLNMYETGKLNPPNYTAAEMNGGYDESTMTYPVKLGEVLDIIIQMVPGETTNLVEAHPWHSHGKKYWDMGVGMGNFSYEALAQTLANRTGTPFRRDTSVAYPGPGASYIGQKVPAGTPGGWRLLRIKVTDPGLWLVHCHITMHQIMGMMVPLLYGAENLPPIPESLTQEYLTFGGGAFGQPTYDYTGEETTDYTPTSYFKAIGS